MNEIMKAIDDAALTPVERGAEGTMSRRYCFNDGSIVYSGHFPGYPILPAIVQIMTARALIEECHGAPLWLLAVEGAKFLMQLRPGQEVRVTCGPKPTDDQKLVYRAQLSVGVETAATFVLRLAVAGETP